MTGPWAISVRTPKKKLLKVISRDEDETLKECLDRTKGYAKSIREKYQHRDDVVVEIISRKKTFPKPDGKVIPRNHLWCPYCAKARRFRTGQIIEIDGVTYASPYRRCEVCTISDNDFHVKTENDLWPKLSEMRARTGGKGKR